MHIRSLRASRENPSAFVGLYDPANGRIEIEETPFGFGQYGIRNGNLKRRKYVHMPNMTAWPQPPLPARTTVSAGGAAAGVRRRPGSRS